MAISTAKSSSVWIPMRSSIINANAGMNVAGNTATIVPEPCHSKFAIRKKTSI